LRFTLDFCTLRGEQEYQKRRALPVARPENPLEYTPTDELYRGSLIRERRREKGLSLEQLATLVGCDPDTLSKVETNGSNPSDQLLAKIAAALEVPLAEFQQAPLHPRVWGRRKDAHVELYRRSLLHATRGPGAPTGTGALGSGVSFDELLPRSRMGQQQAGTSAQQLDQIIALLVNEIVGGTQLTLTPEKRILAERLILENSLSVCEVLANERDQERR
jgi:transcriptional regulator with XRE-family HTH domain